MRYEYVLMRNTTGKWFEDSEPIQMSKAEAMALLEKHYKKMQSYENSEKPIKRKGRGQPLNKGVIEELSEIETKSKYKLLNKCIAYFQFKFVTKSYSTYYAEGVRVVS